MALAREWAVLMEAVDEDIMCLFWFWVWFCVWTAARPEGL
jgi:hypothetical protein